VRFTLFSAPQFGQLRMRMASVRDAPALRGRGAVRLYSVSGRRRTAISAPGGSPERARAGRLTVPATPIEPIEFAEDHVVILDQTRLPEEEHHFRCGSVEEVAEAIRTLCVRGAPLIGIAAAYGIALAARGDPTSRGRRIAEAADLLRATRPTGRNLFWAIDRMVAAAERGSGAADLAHEARSIHEEDARTCRLIGEHGSQLIPAGAKILTICNAGALATGGDGTALAVIRAARAAGNPVEVLACETRPLLQGARLTMWELLRDDIPATLITDGMAATCMARGMVNVIIAGADRIARNGDTANKIGTYSLAVLARHHGLPFYIAAPMSTVDLSLPDGSHIPIEERGPEEVRAFSGRPTAPPDAPVFNPAFDVTLAGLIAAIITERGALRAPYGESLASR
jgi:methylthioribose-1-phosphate isomerase